MRGDVFIFKTRSNQIFALCWFVYSNAYFCRVNLSISLPYMQNELSITKAELGVVASAFFWVYAIGQLINGRLGDKANPRSFVALGLAVAGLSNIAFAFNTSFLGMVILWGVNGFFQSMLWGPIMRSFSAYTEPTRLKRRAAYLSASMITGSLLSYTVIARLAQVLSWQWLYILPGAILVASGALWFWGLRDFATVAGVAAAGARRENPEGPRPKSFWSFLSANRLWVVAVIAVLQGIIKEGVALWGPTLTSEVSGADFQHVLNLFALLPVVNLVAIVLCDKVNAWLHFVEKRTLAVFFAAGTGAAIGLLLSVSFGLAPIMAMLCLLSAAIAAANCVLMSLVPLNFDREGRVSATAGFLDCSAYLGAAVSGPLFGVLADAGGWTIVLGLFVAISACALVVSFFVPDYKKRRRN